MRTNLAEWVDELFDEPIVDLPAEWPEAYNIAPSQTIWTVARDSQHQLRCIKMHWGLLPPWADSRSIGSNMINARCETVLEKPSFRKIIQTHRCLIPADGYYEWQKFEDGSKQPYWISRPDNSPFFFAAIWEQNKKLAGISSRPLLSTSILTTHANDELRELHDRSPVILLNEVDRKRWMNEEPIDALELVSICRPPANDALRGQKVSKKVGNVQNQGPELIESIE